MIAYFDMFSGVSGDMILGALLDAGLEPDALSDSLRGLRIPPFKLDVRSVRRGPLVARHAVWRVEDETEHRHLPEIEALIRDAGFPPAVETTSVAVFRRLAEAEARVHGIAPSEVHFHEVGALDAILDVCAAASGLYRMGIERVEASAFRTGSGWVRSAHGSLPVPAPAVAFLIEGWNVEPTGVEAELTTPTGAAIVTTLARPPGAEPRMRVEHVGYGAGTRDTAERPNCLRILIGQPLETGAEGWSRERMVVVETSVDDMNPQLYGWLEERLVEEGAREVALLPAVMKKGRPGTLVRCLADEGLAEHLARVLFDETTTLGVRLWPVRRLALEREEATAETSLGRVRIKRVRGPDGRRETRPEYEDVRRIAREQRRPLRELMERLAREVDPERATRERPAGEPSVADERGQA